MGICTDKMTETTLGQAYLHQKIAESYCDKDSRFSAVLSAIPWKYIVDCRNDIKDGQKKGNEIRADTSKFSEMIEEAKTIDNIASILHDMIDKSRTEEGTNELIAKYAMPQEDIRTANWAGFSEGTFYTLTRLTPSNY